ncbi:MAG: nucleotidyltransferase family protein [Polyangiales bacterium]|nr:nucleotidyltransferase family protein [Myxococcales bacterium]MCB9658723.1 nucleotidyltransferase family protein [Sandaracinaceae bacterium]
MARHARPHGDPRLPVAGGLAAERGAAGTLVESVAGGRRSHHAALGAWAVREVAAFHLARVAAAAAEAQLPLMVLKGMWLQAYAYENADDRPFADLDLLIPREALGRMHGLLSALGYGLSIHSPGDVARLYTSADGFQLDVHYELFPDGLFRLRGRDVLRRGRTAERLAIPSLLVPEPYDGLAHLVGHFAKGRHGPRDGKLLRDFEELARASQLDPDRAARHLVAGGLRRAAQYALQFGVGGSFAARALAALPPDPVGRRVVNALGTPTPNDRVPRVADRFFAFALDHDLPSGARACVRRGVGLLRDGGPSRLLSPLIGASRAARVGGALGGGTPRGAG